MNKQIERKEEMAVKEKDREVTFELQEHFGIIGTTQKGWKKELNLVSWNEKPAKYDVRDWDSNHSSMGKGITMNKDEAKALSELLNALEL